VWSCRIRDEFSARDTQVEFVDDNAFAKGAPQAGHDHGRRRIDGERA